MGYLISDDGSISFDAETQDNIMLASDSTGNMVITGGSDNNNNQTTESTAAPVNTGVVQEEISPLAAILPSVIWMVAIIGMAYFFMIRPQKKREKQMLEMQSSIGAGDNVVTSTGFYGKVVDIGEDVFVVEFGTNRGVRIPVRKSDIVAIKTPKMTAQSTSE